MVLCFCTQSHDDEPTSDRRIMQTLIVHAAGTEEPDYLVFAEPAWRNVPLRLCRLRAARGRACHSLLLFFALVQPIRRVLNGKGVCVGDIRGHVDPVQERLTVFDSRLILGCRD